LDFEDWALMIGLINSGCLSRVKYAGVSSKLTSRAHSSQNFFGEANSVQEFDSDPSTGLTIRLCRWQQCVCRFELIMRGVTCKLWRDKSGAFHSCFVEFGKLAPSFSIDVLCISVINFWKFDIYWMGIDQYLDPLG
jgi:hypothetical protein